MLGALASPAAALIGSAGGPAMQGREAALRLLVESLLVSGVLALAIPLAAWIYGKTAKSASSGPTVSIVGFSAFGWIAGAALVNALHAP